VSPLTTVHATNGKTPVTRLVFRHTFSCLRRIPFFLSVPFFLRIPFFPFVNKSNPHDPGQSSSFATFAASTASIASASTAASATTQTLFARCAHRHHHGLRHRAARGCRRRAPAKRRTHPALETRA
jgi:hypothetical protein